jgi:putative zinc finger protein
MGCPVEDGGDELIIGYGARTLTPGQQIELERHLEVCQRCRELAEAQRAVWSALDAWPTTVVSPNFDERLFRRIAMEPQSAWRRWLAGHRSFGPAIPVGVACAALIAAFLLKNPALRTEPQSEPGTKLQIEQVEHALDDMDMLTQLGVESAPDKAHPSEKIFRRPEKI